MGAAPSVRGDGHVESHDDDKETMMTTTVVDGRSEETEEGSAPTRQREEREEVPETENSSTTTTNGNQEDATTTNGNQEDASSTRRRCSFESPTAKILSTDSLRTFRKKLRRASGDGFVVRTTSEDIRRRCDLTKIRTAEILLRARSASTKFRDLMDTREALQQGTSKQRWRLLQEKLTNQRGTRPSGTVLARRRSSTIQTDG